MRIDPQAPARPRPRHAALLLCLLAVLSPPPTAAQDAELLEDRARLLAGVEDFTFGGSPGIAVATGARVVDLLHDQAGMSFALAGRHGSGRFAVMTQGLAGSAAPGARRFFDNLLGWLRGRSEAKPILFVQEASTAAEFKKLGLPVVETQRLPADLSAYSLVYLGFPWKEAQDYTDAELARLKDWMASGGGLLCHALGWVYLKYHETGIARQDLRVWSANRLFAPLGAWIAGGLAGSARPVAEGPTSLRTGLAEALACVEGGPGKGPEWADAYLLSLATLQNGGLSIAAQLGPAERERLAKAYTRLGARVQPRADKPVPAADQAARLCVGLLALLGAELGAEGLPRLADATIFPGAVPAGAVSAQEAIWTAEGYARWQSTGWYAPPGATVSVRALDPAPQDFTLRIGSHSDELLWRPDRNPSWRRWPTLIRASRSLGGQSSISSSHGGLLYLELDPDAEGARFTISGAVPAARYRLGATTKEDWQSQMSGPKAVKAPWGELEGERIVLTLPLETLRKIPDPERIAAFWDRAIALLDELTGDPPRDYKERIVTDEQIAYGYMHGGYPVMCLLDNAEVMAGLPGKWDVFEQGSWGLFHELGHNWQKDGWIFDKSWEVTVNIFTTWLMDRLVGIPPGEHPYLKGAVATGEAYKAAGRDFAKWDESKMMAALLFVDLIKAGGWDAFKGFYRHWHRAQRFELPKTDQEKRDTWVRELSRHAGKDLSPIFRDWGIPHSPISWPLEPLPSRAPLVDAAVATDKALYWFRGDSWALFDLPSGSIAPGFPRPIAGDWPFPWTGPPEAAFPAEIAGQAWFTKGSQVTLVDLATRKPVPGRPDSIARLWPGIWPEGFDAAIPYGDGKLYVFKGDSYLTWDLVRGSLVPGGPVKTSSGWRGLDFDRIDEVVAVGRRFWFFRQGWVALYPYGNGRVAEGYPRAAEQDWPGPAAAWPREGQQADSAPKVSP